MFYNIKYSLCSICMNQKHFVTLISSSRHTKFVVAFPCKFDPVWSSFHIILSTIELSSMSFCAVLLWFYCPSCTYSQNHTYFHNPEVPIFGTTWDFTNLSTSTMKWFHFMRIYWCEWHYLLIIMVHILPTI